MIIYLKFIRNKIYFKLNEKKVCFEKNKHLIWELFIQISLSKIKNKNVLFP